MRGMELLSQAEELGGGAGFRILAGKDYDGLIGLLLFLRKESLCSFLLKLRDAGGVLAVSRGESDGCDQGISPGVPREEFNELMGKMRLPYQLKLERRRKVCFFVLAG